jgi:hypothetical protein
MAEYVFIWPAFAAVCFPTEPSAPVGPILRNAGRRGMDG